VPHLIRLHGPWILSLHNDAAAPRRVHLPRDWNDVTNLAASHRLTLERRFHRPTGLRDATRITLILPAAWPIRQLLLNGESIQPDPATTGRQSFDLTTIVRQRSAHDLRIEFEPGPALHAQPYAVALEITEPLESSP
jgi:hypothetical protein